MSQIQVTGEAKIRDIQGPVVSNAGVITALDGDASQYVRGDGTLADFPTSTGGGSSVSYYLNSSVSQGTIGGNAYRQLSKTPVIGAGTDITISANGYVANYITDANDPSLLEVPAGNFNCEFYFSVNSNNHNPYVYAELYKYDGTTFTLLGSNQAIPEYLTNGTTLSAYYFAIPVAVAALTITDRIAIRIYVNVDGRTVTLHTEDNHLCQVVTTFSKGLTSLNNLTRQVQFLATGTSGTDFAISSSTATHTFNLPVASATNTGKLSSTDWSTFNGKVPYTGATANLDLGLFSISGSTLFLNGTPTTIPGYLYLKKIGNAAYINYAGYGGITAYSNNFTFISDVNGTDMKRAIFDLASLTNNTARTYTLPDASGTIALLESNQTFTGGNIFSSNISVSGITIGKGRQAGTGTSNIGIGFAALAANTTGINNLAIGSGTLYNNTTGDNNISLGYNTLEYNTTGGNNIALGLNTLGDNTTGISNIGIGIQALDKSTTADGNIGIGYGALGISTTGAYNTAIGYVAGSVITTGSYNTIIGGYVGTATMSNNIILADGAGNIRYQWNGTNNVFSNPISGTSAVFSSSLVASVLQSTSGIILSTTIQVTPSSPSIAICGTPTGLEYRTATNVNSLVFQAANYTYTFPAATGTIALTSDLSAYVTLATTQTITGAKTFSSNITVNSVQIGSAGNTTNIKLGDSTFGAITTGSNNIAIGTSALTSITTSNANIGIGNSALASVIDGAFNTAIGFGIGGSITSGSNNALFGYGAGSSITTGNYNTILGAYAGTAGMSNNIVLADGQGNIRYQWNGTNNAFTGAATFSSSVTQSGFLDILGGSLSSTNGLHMWFNTSTNIAWIQAFQSGVDWRQINYNGAVHNFLINDVSTLYVSNSRNVGIGTSSPNVNGFSTALTINGSGTSALELTVGGVNQGYIGSNTSNVFLVARTNIPMTFYTNDTERMRITSGGNVGIGNTGNASYRLAVTGNTYITGATSTGADIALIVQNSSLTNLFYVINNGVVNINNLAGTGSRAVLADASGFLSAPVSDISVKQNITTIGYGLNEIMQMNPVWFNFIDEYKNYGEGRQNGNIAQEMESIIPEAVFVTPSTGKMGINYDQFHAVYIKAIQEQQAQIEEQQAQIEELKELIKNK